MLQRPVESAQYTSAQYARLANQHRIQLSVGRRGQCWDNAVAESFFSTIKAELLDRRAWPTRAAAHKAIFTWIETSHQHCLSSRDICEVGEGSGRVVDGAVLQAVVQLAEHEVEQPA
ncbi:integrase core domain-containing protein [Micromonospora sp. NPDC005161]